MLFARNNGINYLIKGLFGYIRDEFVVKCGRKCLRLQVSRNKSYNMCYIFKMYSSFVRNVTWWWH